MTRKVFATLIKLKLSTGNVRGLNLAAVKFTNLKITNDLLFKTEITEALYVIFMGLNILKHIYQKQIYI